MYISLRYQSALYMEALNISSLSPCCFSVVSNDSGKGEFDMQGTPASMAWGKRGRKSIEYDDLSFYFNQGATNG